VRVDLIFTLHQINVLPSRNSGFCFTTLFGLTPDCPLSLKSVIDEATSHSAKPQSAWQAAGYLAKAGIQQNKYPA